MFALISYFLSLCISLAGLIIGANLLVRVGSNLAKKFGLSEGFIGVTFLAWSTSLPEIVISLSTSSRGFTDAAMGNLLGSNICNSFLIMGICSLIVPLGKKLSVKDLCLPQYSVIVISTALFTALFYQANTWWVLSTWESFVLIGLYGIYFALIFWNMSETAQEKGDGLQSKITTRFVTESVIYCSLGILLVYFGGHFSVQAIEKLSKMISTLYGYSSAEKILGLTMLSIGTSLPELITSVVAIIHGKMTMSLSNILGSNMLNKYGILPMSGLISPIIIRDTYLVIYTTMSDTIVPILCFFFWGNKFFSRGLGIFLLALYVLYIFQVVM